jgi:hypothetical protein
MTMAIGELLDLGLIGTHIPLAHVRDVWMQAVDLHPLSTVAAGKAQAFQRKQPRGLLAVHVWSDPESDAPDAKGVLAITHRDDYRALHWVFRESDLPQRSRLWVQLSPARGLLSGMKSSIGIAFEEAGEVRVLKEPHGRLNILTAIPDH